MKSLIDILNGFIFYLDKAIVEDVYTKDEIEQIEELEEDLYESYQELELK